MFLLHVCVSFELSHFVHAKKRGNDHVLFPLLWYEKNDFELLYFLCCFRSTHWSTTLHGDALFTLPIWDRILIRTKSSSACTHTHTHTYTPLSLQAPTVTLFSLFLYGTAFWFRRKVAVPAHTHRHPHTPTRERHPSWILALHWTGLNADKKKLCWKSLPTRRPELEWPYASHWYRWFNVQNPTLSVLICACRAIFLLTCVRLIVFICWNNYRYATQARRNANQC